MPALSPPLPLFSPPLLLLLLSLCLCSAVTVNRGHCLLSFISQSSSAAGFQPPPLHPSFTITDSTPLMKSRTRDDAVLIRRYLVKHPVINHFLLDFSDKDRQMFPSEGLRHVMAGDKNTSQEETVYMLFRPICQIVSPEK